MEELRFNKLTSHSLRSRTRLAASLAVLALGLSMQLTASPPMRIDPSPVPWIRISSISSQDLPLWPELASRLAPYCLRLQNTGSAPVAGIVVVFTFQNAGRTIHRSFFYKSYDLLPGHDVLPPGGALLFTPFAEVNNQVNRGSARRASDGAFITRATSILDLFDQTPMPTGTIDLVIDTEGRYAGPDSVRTIHELQRRKEAYADLRSGVMSLLEQGLPDAQVVEALTAKSQVKVQVDWSTGGPEPFTEAESELASRWLAQLQALGRDAFAQLVQGDTPDKIYPFVNRLKGGLQ